MMSEVERSEENKDENEEISEDLEKIIKTVEEEVVLPEETEEETGLEGVEPVEVSIVEEGKDTTDMEPIYSIMNSINILKAEVRKIYEKVDNLENTIKYLIDSINEIKSVILIVSHSRGGERESVTKSDDVANNINRIIELAEDAILSAVKPDVVRAIKIEALRIELRELLNKAKRKEIFVPSGTLSKIEEVLKGLDKEANMLRKKIMGS